MKHAEHIHTPDDGRGQRRVTVDGREVKRIVYVDTARGIARQVVGLNGRRRRTIRVLFRSIRGKVEVTQC